MMQAKGYINYNKTQQVITVHLITDLGLLDVRKRLVISGSPLYAWVLARKICDELWNAGVDPIHITWSNTKTDPTEVYARGRIRVGGLFEPV